MALIRRFFADAAADPLLEDRRARREYVYEQLNEALPLKWKRRDGKSPDYDRLRPYLAELEAELSRITT